MKKIVGLFAVSFLSAVLAIGIYKFSFEKESLPASNTQNIPNYIPATYTAEREISPKSALIEVDFTSAAEKTVNAVVHVKNVTVSKVGSGSIFDFFYGNDNKRERTQIGTGSGVIISPDGYIVTNNHVIDKATKLEVTLNNNKTYEAELVGADPNTDIALIKISSDDKFPFLVFGDSDTSKIGEWVLAVGNPFNLTSTVTAGIISAKARDLNESDGKNQSFIQTDAAVNPGNSGGALVNTNGDLIGINTAITSQTGSFVGYAFAVPSNIAKKVVDDLLEFGNVQKGILGIRGGGLNSQFAKENNIKDTQGIYVTEVVEGSGAEKAGIKEGDIIKKVDDINTSKFSDLTGYLGSKRPNDIVNVTVKRGNGTKVIPVTLLKEQIYNINQLGISVQNLSRATKENLKDKIDIDYGVLISDVDSPRKSRLKDKILLEIDDVKVRNVNDVENIFSKYTGSQYPESIVVLNQYGEKERIIFE